MKSSMSTKTNGAVLFGLEYYAIKSGWHRFYVCLPATALILDIVRFDSRPLPSTNQFLPLGVYETNGREWPKLPLDAGSLMKP